MRISDWSSDVCSSDLADILCHRLAPYPFALSLSKGRSFFQRRRRKNGSSTSSARTEVNTLLGAGALAADHPLDKDARLWSKGAHGRGQASFRLARAARRRVRAELYVGEQADTGGRASEGRGDQ